MKYYYALCGALIGAGIAMLIHISFTSILIGIAVGVLIGYIVSIVMTGRPTSLQMKFIKMGDLRGRSLDEIVRTAGKFKTAKRCRITDRDNAKGFLYTWTDGSYTIVLLFNSDNVCIGVNKEVKPDK